MIVNLGAGDRQVASAAVAKRYRGFTVRNASASETALIRIFDGTSDQGTILEEVTLRPGESAREYYSDWSFTVQNGVFVHVEGDVTGSVRLS